MNELEKTWSVNVGYDVEEDNYYLPLPDSMCAQLEWNIGDILEWVDNGDKTYTLRKKEIKNENVETD
jgi:bifunctional DNA-binding transcriptional regulator/antitoxin component of YhaV-PrlF toxin-antitoxin module